MKVCLDTSVFTAVKNVETDSQQCERILDAIDDKRIEGATSSLVIAETLVGFYQNNEDKEAEHFLTHATQNHMVSRSCRREANAVYGWEESCDIEWRV